MSKQQTALTKFFDKIRVRYDKDSEEYEQLLTDYVLAKGDEKQQIIDAYEQGEYDGYWHPENGYNKEFNDAIQYYNNKYGQ